ncbi:MAG: gliding motility protein GldN [Bacteroidales bacterium]|nr:gliding motility protein GldN [Bacteroidales bacterium]
MASCLLAAAFSCTAALAQEVEAKHNFNDFYEQTLRQQQEAAPLPYVRQSDVIWKAWIWRIIDMRELFNQFIYFPLEANGAHGRKNLAYTMWDAIVANEIEVYEDDDFLVPKECSNVVEYFTRADTLTLEVINEEDDESYEYRTVFIPREFTSDDIFRYRLKEAWFIDKQQDRQMVRITGLAPIQEQYKDRDGEREYRGSATLFWIPMQSLKVRRMLARHEAYFEPNLANLPSWWTIFSTRMFSSHITRISNIKNRPIDSYLTGTDAIMEADRIENELLNISLDMWEY